MKKKISLREPHRGRKRVGNSCFTKKRKKEQFVGTRADHGSKPSLAVGTAFGHNGNKIAGQISALVARCIVHASKQAVCCSTPV